MTALVQEGAQLLKRMPSDDAAGLLKSFRDCSSPVALYVQQLVSDVQQQLMTDATRSSIPVDEASLVGDALETRLGCATAASLMAAAVQEALSLEDGEIERQEDSSPTNLETQEAKVQALTHASDDSDMQDAGAPVQDAGASAQVVSPSGVEGTAQVVVVLNEGRGVQGGGHGVQERDLEKERRGKGEAAHATPTLVRLSSLGTPAVCCAEALIILGQQLAVVAPRIAAQAKQQDNRLGEGLAKKEHKEEGEKDIESDALDMAAFLAELEASAHEAVRVAIEGTVAEIEAALEQEREREREQEREQAKEQERQRKELMQVALQELMCCQCAANVLLMCC